MNGQISFDGEMGKGEVVKRKATKHFSLKITSYVHKKRSNMAHGQILRYWQYFAAKVTV